MKKRILLKIGLTLSIIYFLTNNVYATKIEITESNKEVKMGETITININISEIDQESGVNIIQGKLEYDKNVFEKIENKNFKNTNNWSMVYNDEDTQSEGKFIIINLSEGIKEDQEITQIKLKAKDDIKSTNTNIKLIELYTVDNDDIIDIENTECEIKVKGKFSITNVFFNIARKIKEVFRIKR